MVGVTTGVRVGSTVSTVGVIAGVGVGSTGFTTGLIAGVGVGSLTFGVPDPTLNFQELHKLEYLLIPSIGSTT